MLKILQARLQQDRIWEFPDKLQLYKRKCKMFSIPWSESKINELLVQEIIDYTKAFDCVDHKTWKWLGVSLECFYQLSNEHDCTLSRSKELSVFWLASPSEKHLFLLYWLCQSLWLCGSQSTVEISERDGNTRPPDLPLEKPICRSRSNS